MRISKVYTRGGDRGQTRLVGGRKVPKSHPRIEAYGTVDELNAILGIVRSFNARAGDDDAARKRIDEFLKRLQNDLFNVGSDLSTHPADRWEGLYRVGDPDVERLEQWCDDLNADLDPLEEFILPGGGPVGAHLHQARTVCRRAERRTYELIEQDPDVGEGVLRYLNRLSDFLFILGRWAAKAHDEPEYFWEKPGAGDDQA